MSGTVCIEPLEDPEQRTRGDVIDMTDTVGQPVKVRGISRAKAAEPELADAHRGERYWSPEFARLESRGGAVAPRVAEWRAASTRSRIPGDYVTYEIGPRLGDRGARGWTVRVRVVLQRLSAPRQPPGHRREVGTTA